MRNVLFVAPFPMATTVRFCAALRTLSDVRLLGIFQKPPSAEVVRFDDLVLVDNALDPASIAAGVETLTARHGAPHRLLGVLEDLQVQLAQVRAKFGIEGPDPDTADKFRDKGRMKDALRAAGLPCARHARIQKPQDAWDFLDKVGFPIVVKPPAGAAARATYRIDHFEGMQEVLNATQPTPEREILAEEFLSGQEFSFETLTVGGEVKFHSIGRYYPAPLEVLTNDWIQWCVHLPRDISGPEFDPVRAIGPATVAALGLQDGMTHMEWFRRPDGSPAIGEIAARPPGANIVKLMSYAHDTDLYRAWARAVVDGAFDGPFERKFSTGCAFLRGPGNGRITSITGLDEAQARMGQHVVEAQLPQVGHHKSSSYEGDGWAIVRHEDSEVVKQALLDLVRTVRIRYA